MEMIINNIVLFLAVLLHAGLGLVSKDLNARNVLFLVSVVMYLSQTNFIVFPELQLPMAQVIFQFVFFLLSIEIATIAVWYIEALLIFIPGEPRVSWRQLAQFVVAGSSLVLFVITARATIPIEQYVRFGDY